ncbi:MAG: hypothetical protein ACXWRE_01295 [Pseudobdellovibrionaceae bacterium]
MKSFICLALVLSHMSFAVADNSSGGLQQAKLVQYSLTDAKVDILKSSKPFEMAIHADLILEANVRFDVDNCTPEEDQNIVFSNLNLSLKAEDRGKQIKLINAINIWRLTKDSEIANMEQPCLPNAAYKNQTIRVPFHIELAEGRTSFFEILLKKINSKGEFLEIGKIQINGNHLNDLTAVFVQQR